MHPFAYKTTLAAILGVLAGSAALADPVTPQHVTVQPAGLYTIRVGDVSVTALSDGSVPQDLHKLLHRTTIKHIDSLLARNFQANPVEVSINAYLLRLPGHLTLVDTGAGALFGPGYGGKLVEALARAGVTPDQITDILLTHAHSDHAGGLVANGHRVFVNATVHVGKPDVDFFFDGSNQARTGYDKSYFDIAQTTLMPYLDAGKLAPFAGTQDILPGVTGEIHPGHTPGSAFYILTSQGESIAFIGDIIHSSAVQFPDPAVTIDYDQDETNAAHVRAETFARLAKNGELIAAPHLSFPGIGHVRTDPKGGYDWVPVTYTNRE